MALFIDRELGDKAYVHALSDKEEFKASGLRQKLRSCPKVCATKALIPAVNLVIEAAGAAAVAGILKGAIKEKKDVIILSVGALINNRPLIKKAARKGVTIRVPSGAICGVDGLGALSTGTIRKVSLITSKPPRGLRGNDYFKKRRIPLDNLKKERIVFRGGVKQAIKYFPKNINVAATLLLASLSRNIKIYIKADPKLKRNVHRIEVEAREAKVSMNIENVPSDLNPKTSALAILSTQYLLKKLFSPFKIGS